MSLAKTFRAIAPGIVAFGSKILKAREGPPFPEILGTGFVIDSRGIVATNRHVAESLMTLPAHPRTGEPSAFALVYSSVQPEREGHSLGAVMVDIKRYDIIDSFVSDEDYYGEDVPDLAFVQLDVLNVPALSLARDEWTWHIGMPVATAGFAMGSAALAIYGKINSITPLLRHGIISSLFPFPCPMPHGFTMDILTQGGESGSPVFAADEPLVVGILHAGFDNANITLAVPSSMVAEAYRALSETVQYDFSGVLTLDERLRQGVGVSGPTWEVV